jgi:hypothetical protein
MIKVILDNGCYGTGILSHIRNKAPIKNDWFQTVLKLLARGGEKKLNYPFSWIIWPYA